MVLLMYFVNGGFSFDVVILIGKLVIFEEWLVFIKDKVVLVFWEEY